MYPRKNNQRREPLDEQFFFFKGVLTFQTEKTQRMYVLIPKIYIYIYIEGWSGNKVMTEVNVHRNIVEPSVKIESHKQ